MVRDGVGAGEPLGLGPPAMWLQAAALGRAGSPAPHGRSIDERNSAPASGTLEIDERDPDPAGWAGSASVPYLTFPSRNGTS